MDPIRPIEIEIGIDPRPVWHLALMPPSNLTSESGKHPNNTVAVPGASSPNPRTRPFDTDSDTDLDPELASPWSFRTTAGEKSPATEGTENTEAHVFPHLNTTRLK
jgi:hypothetical protein